MFPAHNQFSTAGLGSMGNNNSSLACAKTKESASHADTANIRQKVND